MSNATPAITIPNDLNSCQALIEQLAGTVEEQAGKIEKLDREKQDIQLAYKELLQRAFRRRSERYLTDLSQLTLDFGDSSAGRTFQADRDRQRSARHRRHASDAALAEKYPAARR